MLLFNIPCGKMASQLKAILLCVIVWVTSRTNPLCRGMIGRFFFIEGMIGRQTTVIQIWAFGRRVLETKRSEFLISRKTTNSIGRP